MNTTELKKLAEAASLTGAQLVGMSVFEFAEAQRLKQQFRQIRPAAILKLLAINAELVDALKDAATSLETINRLAGKASYGVDEDGPIPTYMGHHDEVRAYAGSRAGCARAALAKAEGGEL